MIGERIGSYTIVEKLGEGGMGEVYRATDSRARIATSRSRFSRRRWRRTPQTMARFEREAQVLASLNHPNIAAIYGLEETGGARALVMELVDGRGRSRRASRAAPLPLEEALRDRAADRRGARGGARARASSIATSSRPTSSCTRRRATRQGARLRSGEGARGRASAIVERHRLTHSPTLSAGGDRRRA